MNERQPLKDSNRSPRGFSFAAAFEDLLARHPDALRALFDRVQIGIFVLDAAGRILLHNESARRIWGGTRLVGPEGYGEYRAWWPRTGQPVRAEEWAASRALAKGETTVGEMVRIETFDGSRKTILNSAFPLFGPKREIEGVVVVNEDITENQRARALQSGQLSVLEAIVADDPLPSILETLCHVIEEQNPEMLTSVLLLEPEGMRLRHGAAPSLPAVYTAAIDGAPIGPEAGSCGTACWRGESVFVADIASDPLWASYRHLALPHGLAACWSKPFLATDGRVLGSFAMYYREPRVPTTAELRLIETASRLAGIAVERKQADEALRRSEARLREAEAIGKLGYWEMEVATRRCRWSDEVHRMLDRPRGGAPLEWDEYAAYLDPDSRARLQACVRRSVEEGVRTELDQHVRLSGGRTAFLQGIITPVRGPDGTVTRLVGTLQDVTERVELESRLLEAQKLDSIGRLAGGVAHDFNNMLTAILGGAETLEGLLPASGEGRDALQTIKSAAERSAALTGQLLAFARRQVIAPRAACLNELVRDAEKLVRRLIGEHIEISLRLEPDLWSTSVDVAQFTQVFLNMALNARDAMPRGGHLVIETRNRVLDQDEVRHRPDVFPGDYVTLSFADDGVGMSESTRQHVFEPFFTTKEEGRGTGLGLSTCFGIVKQHHGHIDVTSEPGRGTTFTIVLPRRLDERPAASDAGAIRARRGTETVLVVEDERIVRQVATAALRARGYTVLDAADGEEALRIASEHRGGIDLLLTDVVLPRLDGIDLAEKLLRSRPSMRILFTSGYSESSLTRPDSLAHAAFIQKPYTHAALVSRIREVLDEGA